MSEHTYTIHVCSLCGSDDIMSNSEDSYCNECREWMSSIPLEVRPTLTLEEAWKAVSA